MAKLHDILVEHLKKEPNFVSDNGDLKKWVIIHKAQNYDEDLIELLINNEILKDKFFLKIKDVLVFNQNLFVQFLEQKNYLNDSYTRFRNKIGLTIDDKYFNQINNVSLVWPFKDCVLEGGQSYEEDKRDEVFFNEILAQDEITQLFESKVLTNAKRYNKNGGQPFDKFDRDDKGTIKDNLIIKGNNLLALHSLKKEFAGKVKLIYIDPPYNTGGDANIFTYNNSFNHSTWLTFMRNRLLVAKQFLKKDGFIAIAIDHYELGYLITLADEIFGIDNRLGIISVVNNPMGRNQAKYFSTINDFMLVYAKDTEFASFNNVILNEEFLKTFNQTDELGKYKLQNFIRVGGGDANLRINKESFWYPIFVSSDLKDITLDKKENYTAVYPVTSTGIERTWKLSKNSTNKKLKELVAVKKSDRGIIEIMEKYRVDKGQKVPTVWSDKKYNSNHNGIRLLEKIVGHKNFSFPKSLYTIIDTIKLLTNPGDIILDFHAGSGTTAHAVLELNIKKEDLRQFILVEQLNEHINICNQRVQKVISNKKSNESFVYFELKKYNQKFIESVEKAENTDDLMEVWENMKSKSFLNYNIDMKTQENNIELFKELSVKEQKHHLLEILDKNQLYVNLSSLFDKDFKCSLDEVTLTQDFYNI